MCTIRRSPLFCNDSFPPIFVPAEKQFFKHFHSAFFSKNFQKLLVWLWLATRSYTLICSFWRLFVHAFQEHLPAVGGRFCALLSVPVGCEIYYVAQHFFVESITKPTSSIFHSQSKILPYSSIEKKTLFGSSELNQWFLNLHIYALSTKQSRWWVSMSVVRFVETISDCVRLFRCTLFYLMGSRSNLLL